jgi:hypothetical protein
VTDETWTKAATTAADEEEIMTGQARSPFADMEDDDEIDADAEEEALRRAAAEAEEESGRRKREATDGGAGSKDQE